MTTGPGLPAERTALAWQRTAVAELVLSAFVVLVAARRGSPALLALAAAAAAVAVAAALAVIPRSAGRRHESVHARLVAVALATTVLGLVAAAAAVGSAGAHHP